MNAFTIDEIVRRAVAEDVGPGDLTTEACVPADARGEAVVLVKAPGVICGHPVARAVFAVVDPAVVYEELVPEGTFVERGTVVARIIGPARALLSGERVALNFLQRLSGIATATRTMAERITGTGARLIDTRKTTPGLRVLEKYAIRVGGGHNHRFALFDGVLIKDNHIAIAGGIRPAIEACRRSVPHTCKIEVEVDSLEQIDEALAAGADIILLDNMSAEAMRQAVARVAGRALLEASGGIDLNSVRAAAESGVDLVSSGALTHSARALDISLDIAVRAYARQGGSP